MTPLTFSKSYVKEDKAHYKHGKEPGGKERGAHHVQLPRTGTLNYGGDLK